MDGIAIDGKFCGVSVVVCPGTIIGAKLVVELVCIGLVCVDFLFVSNGETGAKFGAGGPSGEVIGAVDGARESNPLAVIKSV